MAKEIRRRVPLVSRPSLCRRNEENYSRHQGARQGSERLVTRIAWNDGVTNKNRGDRDGGCA